jgi:hypothetical protein
VRLAVRDSNKYSTISCMGAGKSLSTLTVLKAFNLSLVTQVLFQMFIELDVFTLNSLLYTLVNEIDRID